MQEEHQRMKVSVPSRGLSYLNEIQRNEKIQFISFRPLTGTLLSKHREWIGMKLFTMVSVPSRGLSYLNDINKIYNISAEDEFPSPHGDSLI